MNKIVNLENEIGKLEEECEFIGKYMSSVMQEIRDRKIMIRHIKRKHRFKYKGKIYYVVIVPFKTYRSTLKGQVIYINSNLSKVDRQRELHIILKRKKCLTWF